MTISLSLTRDEFAARRRAAQEEAEQAILRYVRNALQTQTHWNNALGTQLLALWNATYMDEAGEPYVGERDANTVSMLQDRMDEYATSQSSPEATALMLVTAILNDATIAAAANDEEFIGLEWVTMHDSAVREPHRLADGQVRPAGEKYDVGGVEMSMPGDVSAPIELWINCRCALRPTLLDEEFSGEEHTMTTMPSFLKETFAPSKEEEEIEDIEPEQDEDIEIEDVVDPLDSLVPWHGVLAPEGVKSGDGRSFAPDALTWRDLPLPLTYQKASADGHSGSITVGSIETIERRDGLMLATGYMLATPEADEVVGLMAHFGKYGVSIDADDAEFEFNEETGEVTFNKGRICSASIVSIPAFAEAYVALGPWEEDEAFEGLAASAFAKTEDGPGWLTHPVDTDRLRDYWTRGAGAAKIGWGTPGDFNRCRLHLAKYVKPQYLNGYCANRHYDALGSWPGRGAHAVELPAIEDQEAADAVRLVASGGYTAPAEWFKNPNLDRPTHLTVTKEGRVYGHIAQWGVCHIGMGDTCTTAPKGTGYSYYATGMVLLDDDTFAQTGVISLGGGHAGPGLKAAAAIEHYDNTSAAVCDVTIGDDEHGIWCAGWVRPGTTEEQIVALRASDVSGDWRKIGGQWQLVAALACNVAGFPVKAHVKDGVQVALVAAGVVRAEEPKGNESVPEFDYNKFAEAMLVAQQRFAAQQERVAALRSTFNKE